MTHDIRVPTAYSLPSFATDQARQAIQLTGRALPCSVTKVSGAVVTVKFEVNAAPITLPSVTMPIATWAYAQAPVQVGDRGLAMPADAYMGGVSGLGGGTADLTPRGNLATLVFAPVGNATWARRDPAAYEITGHGSSGLNVQDGSGATSFVVNASGVTISNGGVTVTINSSGITLSGG